MIILGGIIAGIAVIWSGIVYVTAGSNSTRVQDAKSMLKAAIIGALILFSVGVIISTIRNFASNPNSFFGTGTCRGGLRSGAGCSANSDCPRDPPGTCGGAGQPLCSFSLCY